jgi:tRNA1(Val) A37 N6-methylase TrmN6
MPRDEHATLTLRLREAAEHCIVSLGTGLLRDHAGKQYFERIRSNRSCWPEYFQQLRSKLLQIVAWMLGERRGAVPRGTPTAIAKYGESYCSACLIAGEHEATCGERSDPWSRLQRVLVGLWKTDDAIGVTQWGSELFDPVQTKSIRKLSLDPAATRHLLAWISSALIEPCLGEPDADIQLLGNIHEWLMERQLVVDAHRCSVSLEAYSGHERRATGSYFTPAPLVEHLLDVCLEPVLEARINKQNPGNSANDLLRLRIVDPACGTGIFLIAAARRLARRIAALDDSAMACQAALREVVGRCVYGVDIGPTTTSLCRLALWFACGEPYQPIPTLQQHILCGNSTFGARPGYESVGVPNAAMEASEGDDVEYARELRSRNRAELRGAQSNDTGNPCDAKTRTHDDNRFLADLWCATFVWQKTAGTDVPTHADFKLACGAPEVARARWGHELQSLAKRFRFFHWWLEFADIFSTNGESGHSTNAASGFDVVLGNPPWVAYAGRSTQPLHGGLKRFYSANYEAFAGFPTTHGIFVELATRLVGDHGRIGLVVPASVADLAGYAPTRKAHDQRCRQLCPLPDFGEGRFTGVTQPCVALVSERLSTGVETASLTGAAWQLERSDLDEIGLGLLERLSQCRTFPDELFGERGFQSTPTLRDFIQQQDQPQGEFTVPLREGTDVREFQLGRVRHYADPCLFGRGLRTLAEFGKVALVVRQTARYPIAAKGDGQAFRNSLLAVLHDAQWPWSVMLCLLNSALFRWCHYYRFRDGRQPILPQLKVGHLRSLPAPADRGVSEFAELETLGSQLAERNRGVVDAERMLVDTHVSKLYGLSESEYRMVIEWHAQRPR